MQKRQNSIANALELCLFCINPIISQNLINESGPNFSSTSKYVIPLKEAIRFNYTHKYGEILAIYSVKFNVVSANAYNHASEKMAASKSINLCY